jgi:hypothetical protein
MRERIIIDENLEDAGDYLTNLKKNSKRKSFKN